METIPTGYLWPAGDREDHCTNVARTWRALLENNELTKKGTTCHGWGVNWYWYIVHPVITVRSTAKLCVPGFHDVVNAKKSRWFMGLGLQFSSPQWIISPHLTGHPGLLQFIPGIGPITATTNCDNWDWIQVIAVQFHNFTIFYQVVYLFPIVPALLSQEWLGYTLGGWPYLLRKCSDSYGLNMDDIPIYDPLSSNIN